MAALVSAHQVYYMQIISGKKLEADLFANAVRVCQNLFCPCRYVILSASTRLMPMRLSWKEIICFDPDGLCHQDFFTSSVKNFWQCQTDSITFV